MARYEILRSEAYPFDIMCSDCTVHQIEYWGEISLEELHEFHRECMEADEYTPEIGKKEYEEMTGEKWVDTPADFEEFLKEEIQRGYIRIAEEAKTA